MQQACLIASMADASAPLETSFFKWPVLCRQDHLIGGVAAGPMRPSAPLLGMKVRRA
jgi:hypothetical protein